MRDCKHEGYSRPDAYCPDCDVSWEIVERDQRIAELGKVAVNAVIVCNLTEDSSMIHQLLERPLRAAGYLGVGSE